MRNQTRQHNTKAMSKQMRNQTRQHNTKAMSKQMRNQTRQHNTKAMSKQMRNQTRQRKNFIVTPERLVTRLNSFISIIPASSRTVKILSPMTHPILQNVFIIPLPDCLLVVIVHQVLIFLFSHSIHLELIVKVE
jgi:hypothetical protein